MPGDPAIRRSAHPRTRVPGRCSETPGARSYFDKIPVATSIATTIPIKLSPAMNPDDTGTTARSPSSGRRRRRISATSEPRNIAIAL